MWLLRIVACCWLLVGSVVDAVPRDASALAIEMTTRYAPYADWSTLVDVDALARQSQSRYWRTPEEIRSERREDALPLDGLHLALDPGHIGGRWAADEGRHFRIAEEDYYVREGELVLEVAQRVKSELSALGCKVTLLREENLQVNPKCPIDYLQLAAEQVPEPEACTVAALCEYGRALRARAVRLSIVTGELQERARLVNELIQPDALLSLHINAAAWPMSESESESEREGEREGQGGESNGGVGGFNSDLEDDNSNGFTSDLLSGIKNAFKCDYKNGFIDDIMRDLYGDKGSDGVFVLSESNHLHALIFGCMSAGELQSGHQREQLAVKLVNESGATEFALGDALMTALAEATGLPASTYAGRNAILLDAEQPYVFARNLLMVRMAECPTVLLEPYVANSVAAYPRIQAALANRAAGRSLAEADILVEYADAVIAGVLACYGNVAEVGGNVGDSL